MFHDDVIKLKHFPRFWRSPVDSPHKGQWRGAWMFSVIWVWTNGWANNRDAGDLRRHRAHYDVTVILCFLSRYRVDKTASTAPLFGICPVLDREGIVRVGDPVYALIKNNWWRWFVANKRWPMDFPWQRPTKCENFQFHDIIVYVEKCRGMSHYKHVALPVYGLSL